MRLLSRRLAIHTPTQGSADTLPVLRIDSRRGHLFPEVGELWEFREMLYFLVWRDIKVRYKQTVLGAAWAVLVPFITMVVFSIFFGNVLQISTGDAKIPYPLFSFTALVPWTFFATAVGLAATSLVDHGHIIRKVYFPNIFLPLARILGSMVDYLISFIVLLGMIVLYVIVNFSTTPGGNFYSHMFGNRLAFALGLDKSLAGFGPTPNALIVLPLLTLLTIAIALGISLWLSALYVRYRDIRHILPFLIQIWLFATPVIYPTSKLDESIHTLYGLNPMVTVVEGFRAVLLNGVPPTFPMIVASVGMTFIFLITGMAYFQHTKGLFADVI